MWWGLSQDDHLEHPSSGMSYYWRVFSVSNGIIEGWGQFSFLTTNIECLVILAVIGCSQSFIHEAFSKCAIITQFNSNIWPSSRSRLHGTASRCQRCFVKWFLKVPQSCCSSPVAMARKVNSQLNVYISLMTTWYLSLYPKCLLRILGSKRL